MKISKFFDNEYINYAIYDSYRSIGNYLDGLKPSARKVIHTVRKKNIKNDLKVSILASDVARETEYLHGQVSLEGVIVGLAQDYTGSNNINLLSPEGSFGNRTIPAPAASRYIFTKKNNALDKIIQDKDDEILISQEFEGSIIEPRFFMPIIPMILVNGSEGIGNGYAQKIVSRNPKELIKYIEDYLQNKKQTSKKIFPWFKDFKGNILWNEEEGNWHIYGTFERTNQTTITITELPVGYNLESYLNVLNRLEEDKVINDYTDDSSKNTFAIEVKVPREFIKKDDDYIFTKLKLIKRYSENFTCIGENNEIVEFKNEIEILERFIEVRLRYYHKRKEHQIKKMKKELFNLGAKYYFVKAVVEDRIQVFKKTKLEVETQIKNNKDFPFHKLESFDFLLGIQIGYFTKDKMQELKDKLTEMKNSITLLESTDVKDIWYDELQTLKGKSK